MAQSGLEGKISSFGIDFGLENKIDNDMNVC